MDEKEQKQRADSPVKGIRAHVKSDSRTKGGFDSSVPSELLRIRVSEAAN